MRKKVRPEAFVLLTGKRAQEERREQKEKDAPPPPRIAKSPNSRRVDARLPKSSQCTRARRGRITRSAYSFARPSSSPNRIVQVIARAASTTTREIRKNKSRTDIIPRPVECADRSIPFRMGLDTHTRVKSALSLRVESVQSTTPEVGCLMFSRERLARRCQEVAKGMDGVGGDFTGGGLASSASRKARYGFAFFFLYTNLQTRPPTSTSRNAPALLLRCRFLSLMVQLSWHYPFAL